MIMIKRMNIINIIEKYKQDQLRLKMSEKMIFHINIFLANTMPFYFIHGFKFLRNFLVYKQPVSNRNFENGFIQNSQFVDIVSKPYKFWP